MKKFLKIMLCIMGSPLAVIVAFWFSISYTVNYKKTTCDTSVSPDGKYELTLQAVGEPDWPFGMGFRLSNILVMSFSRRNEYM